MNEFTWCLHCEHVFKTDRWLSSQKKCPSCGASMIFDGWPWTEETSFIRLNGYPIVPEDGGYYPLYPESE